MNMRDALYEAPGPRARARMRVGTAVAAVAVAGLLAFVVYQFWATGQLDPRYWEFFTWGAPGAFCLRAFWAPLRWL